MRYIIFAQPPTTAQVIESGDRSTVRSGPVWYSHHFELVFPPNEGPVVPDPVVPSLRVNAPRTSVDLDEPSITDDQTSATQVIGGLRWVDRDDSVSKVMTPLLPPTATGTALDEDDIRFRSTILQEVEEEGSSLASGNRGALTSNSLCAGGENLLALFPPPSQLPLGRTSHETQASKPRPHEHAQDVSASFISSASTSTTTHAASQIDVGLPPTLHFSISSLTPFDRFHSLLRTNPNKTNRPIHRLSILCVVIDISGPKSLGPRGQTELWEWTTLDPLSAPSMPVKISLWEGVGRTLSHATRRGDVVLLTRMSLKRYQTNLQLSTARETQLQVCWRVQLVQEYDLLFRFHEYWAEQSKEARTVLAMKDAYAAWLGR